MEKTQAKEITIDDMVSSTYDVWAFLAEEHDLILTESQVHDIIQVVTVWQKKQTNGKG